MSKPIDIFGSTDPRKMPKHLFWGAVHLEYKGAIRGNPRKQNYSVCPRHWYVDADFQCGRCHRVFTWTARQQKTWFENHHFWIDSRPRLCKGCMVTKKRLMSLRKEYDAIVAEAQSKRAFDLKRRVVEIVRELECACTVLPEKMVATKKLFEHQIRKAGRDGVGKQAVFPESGADGDNTAGSGSDMRSPSCLAGRGVRSEDHEGS